MTVARLEWKKTDSSVVSSKEDLARLINELATLAAQARPFIVEIVLESGDSLGAGVGRAMSVLNFVSGTGDPPYYQSVGEPTGHGEDLIRFDFGGEPTEFSMRAAIPAELAIRAMCSFFEDGRLPDFIDWVEV